MIKAIIVDDNQDAIEYLNALCEKYCEEILITGTCTSVEKAIELTKKVKPELVFLDIEIKNKTGFDYLNALDQIDFDIIFTTGHESYAIKAIKYAALDYLLKPISKDELIAAVDRFNVKKEQSLTQHQVVHLLENLKSDDPFKRLSIPNMTDVDVVFLKDVLYFESAGSSTVIQTKTKKFVISKGLIYYADIINKNFFKTHKEVIVNLNHVKKFFKGDGGYALMSNGDNVKVAVRRRPSFLKALGY